MRFMSVMAERGHRQRALLLAAALIGRRGTAMTKTSALRFRAACEGLQRLAGCETQWDGDKEKAPSSLKRFPPVDAILSDLERASDRRVTFTLSLS